MQTQPKGESAFSLPRIPLHLTISVLTLQSSKQKKSATRTGNAKIALFFYVPSFLIQVLETGPVGRKRESAHCPRSEQEALLEYSGKQHCQTAEEQGPVAGTGSVPLRVCTKVR